MYTESLRCVCFSRANLIGTFLSIIDLLLLIYVKATFWKTMAICGICNINDSKYKCPKCSVNYCSIPCFKSSNHTHDIIEGKNTVDEEKSVAASAIEPGSKFDKLVNDSQIQSMLKYKSLQFHMSVILKIINDASITGESVLENRKEIANLKLTNLRSGGLEQNELVEDFVERVLFLLSEE